MPKLKQTPNLSKSVAIESLINVLILLFGFYSTAFGLLFLLTEACQPRTWFLCLKIHPEKGLGYTGILNCQCVHQLADKDFLLVWGIFSGEYPTTLRKKESCLPIVLDARVHHVCFPGCQNCWLSHRSWTCLLPQSYERIPLISVPPSFCCARTCQSVMAAKTGEAGHYNSLSLSPLLPSSLPRFLASLLISSSFWSLSGIAWLSWSVSPSLQSLSLSPYCLLSEPLQISLCGSLIRTFPWHLKLIWTNPDNLIVWKKRLQVLGSQTWAYLRGIFSAYYISFF